MHVYLINVKEILSIFIYLYSKGLGYKTTIQWLSYIWTELDQNLIKLSFDSCTTYLHAPLAKILDGIPVSEYLEGRALSIEPDSDDAVSVVDYLSDY